VWSQRPRSRQGKARDEAQAAIVVALQGLEPRTCGL
jgi:hypothetical protein